MTSLGQLLGTIRAATLVPTASVNYGITDNVRPPYISVGDYRYEWERDTQNGVRVSTFSVLVVDKSLDDAEALAGSVNDLLENNYAATDQGIGLLQDTYEVGQTDPSNLYQYGVKMTYTMWEDPNK